MTPRDDTAGLDTPHYLHIRLGVGRHERRGAQLCLLEAAAYLGGEQHTDRPRCVSAALTGYAQALNDTLPAKRRQELTSMLPALIATGSDGGDRWRRELAGGWLVGAWLPAWLCLVPALRPHADQLRAHLNADRTPRSAVWPRMKSVMSAAWAEVSRIGQPTNPGHHAHLVYEHTFGSVTQQSLTCTDTARGAAHDALLAGYYAALAARTDHAGITTVVDQLQCSAIDLFRDLINLGSRSRSAPTPRAAQRPGTPAHEQGTALGTADMP